MGTTQQNSHRTLTTQVVQYLVAGGAWFWSGYIIIVILDDLIPLFWANLIGNAVGITINFLLQRFWVFSASRKTKISTTTWRYVVYTGLNSFVLNYLILAGLRSVGIEPEIGQFIAAGFFTVWNYFWYKAWVFKGAEKPKKEKTA